MSDTQKRDSPINLSMIALRGQLECAQKELSNLKQSCSPILAPERVRDTSPGGELAKEVPKCDLASSIDSITTDLRGLTYALVELQNRIEL